MAVKYWQCSYEQTTRYQDKALIGKDDFHYRNMDYPAALPDKQRAMACTDKGLEYIEKSLELDPENPDTYIYKGLLYRERQKLTKEESKRKDLDAIAVKIGADATELQKKKQAEAAEKKAQEQSAPKS